MPVIQWPPPFLPSACIVSGVISPCGKKRGQFRNSPISFVGAFRALYPLNGQTRCTFESSRRLLLFVDPRTSRVSLFLIHSLSSSSLSSSMSANSGGSVSKHKAFVEYVFFCPHWVVLLHSDAPNYTHLQWRVMKAVGLKSIYGEQRRDWNQQWSTRSTFAITENKSYILKFN